MSNSLRQLIRILISETLDDSIELSELQSGMIRDELRKSRVFRNAGLNVDEFSADPNNFEDWSRILSKGNIRYLGSGRQGTAFSLGKNLVLKLEPGRPRASEIEDALYSGTDVGSGLPSILDTGMFMSNIGPIGWSIIEKVSEASSLGEDPEWKLLWKSISDGIAVIVGQEQKKAKSTGQPPVRFVDRNPQQLAAELIPMLPEAELKSVEERYRLSSDWFLRFVKGILSHYKLGMVDFKPDNMGIRRVRGGEGEVIFFDAASALRRDVKKWEPKQPGKG